MAANIYLTAKMFEQAQNHIKQAELYLEEDEEEEEGEQKHEEEDDSKDKLLSQAEIYTTKAMLSFSTGKPQEAKEQIMKSESYWSEIGNNKHLYPPYGQSVMFRCTVHGFLKEFDEMCRVAETSVAKSSGLYRLWLLNLLVGNGKSQYGEDLILSLKEEKDSMSPEQFLELEKFLNDSREKYRMNKEEA